MDGFETLKVQAADGVIDARLFVPAGKGPFPLVVCFMDAFGLRPAMTAMAMPLVEAGYAVLQPNLYRRAGPFAPFNTATVWDVPEERARIKALMDCFTPSQAMADARLLLAQVAGDDRIASDRIGCIGYCMGGRMTMVAAAALSDRVVAAAAIHAGGLVTPTADSPHLGAPKIRAKVYIGVADADASCSPEAVVTLEAALTAAGVDHRIELNPGARHGYAVPDNAPYDAPAAARHWERVQALFKRTLGAG